MFEKLSSLYDLFRKGESVADPEKWKHGQIAATTLAGVFMAVVKLAKGFGYDLHIDETASLSIAGGIITVVNIVLTFTTSKSIGLPAKQSALPEISEEFNNVPAAAIVQKPTAVRPVSPSLIEEAKAALEKDRGR